MALRTEILYAVSRFRQLHFGFTLHTSITRLKTKNFLLLIPIFLRQELLWVSRSAQVFGTQIYSGYPTFSCCPISFCRYSCKLAQGTRFQQPMFARNKEIDQKLPNPWLISCAPFHLLTLVDQFEWLWLPIVLDPFLLILCVNFFYFLLTIIVLNFFVYCYCSWFLLFAYCRVFGSLIVA